MAVAEREPSGRTEPDRGRSIDVPPGPVRALRLVPDGPDRAAVPDTAVLARRWQGSLVAYFLILLAGVAVGVQVAATFLASKSGACSGADAPGRCVLDNLAAPALTRFALVLVCAHALATLVLDVLPEIARKLRAGYRPRRAPRTAPVPVGLPGEPVSLLAAACWAPVQAPRHAPTSRAAVARRASAHAVCPACVTVVVARQGTCPDCRTAVVARRG